jgi:hypothetical protein
VLRAKVDMASPNMHMRDPIIYRIIKSPHHRTGSAWNVYPMYDFAHGQSDYFEGITHSLCTLEFEVHRPLYDWFLSPGNEVRLKYAYIVKCVNVIKNNDGEITEVHCTYDPLTRSGMPDANRKVKSTIHWVSVDLMPKK